MFFHRLYYQMSKLYFKVRKPLTIGVRVLLFKEPDQVLLIKHTYIPGWYFPGGGVKKEETLVEAVAREVFEEVAVTLQGPSYLIGAYSNLKNGKSDHVIVYRCDQWTQGSFSNHEVQEARLFSIHNLPPDISPATSRRLNEVFLNVPREEKW